MYILKQIDGPDRKVAAIALPIPPGSDVATVFGSIKAKMILGEVSPDEALAWFTALEKGVKAVHDQLAWGAVDRRMDEASADAVAAEAAERDAADEAAVGDGEPSPVELAPDPDPSAPSAPAGERGEGGVAPPAPAVQVDAPTPPGDRHAAAPPPSQPSPTRGEKDPVVPAETVAAAPEAPIRPVAAPAPVTPPAPPVPVPQPCFSPAFPGRRRSIVAARTAAEEAARRAAIPPMVQPTGDRRPEGG